MVRSLTNIAGAGAAHRLDHWCAAALMTSAALQVANSTGGLARGSPNVHLIPYSWVPVIVEASVLFAVAISFATGRDRAVGSAFLVGFSATALFDVAFGVERMLSRGTGYSVLNVSVSFSAAVLEVGVAARALAMTMARPRRQVSIPRAATLVVVIAVVLAVTETSSFRAVDSIVGILILSAVAVIPFVALGRAEAAVPMLCGLTASLILDLATRRLFLHQIGGAFRTDFASFAIVLGVVSLGIMSIVVRLRTVGMDESCPNGVVSS